MTATINASTTAGVVTTADTSGILQLQTNGTAALTISASQVATFAQAPSLPAGSIPQAALATNVAGNGPAFSYYQSSSQTLSTQTFTKITFTTSEFDTTGGMYANSRFTPTVAGYYQVSFGVSPGVSATGQITSLYKNGAQFKTPYYVTASSATSAGSVLVYFNGSTDYVEVYAWFLAGQAVSNTSYYTYFQAAMVRSA